MLYSKKLVNKLENDVKTLQFKIEHRKLYNIKCNIIKCLLKCAIFLDYSLPFILVAIILANYRSLSGNLPFRGNLIKENAKVYSVDTSNDFHEKTISYDFEDDEESVEYSTGWVLKENGLYERIVTTYKLNDNVDLEDIDTILKMSKEEVENTFVLINVSTIRKNIMDASDAIYNEPSIIVNNYFESDEYFITRRENFSEIAWNSLTYLIETFAIGYFLSGVGNFFIKTHLRDKFRKYDSLFRVVNVDEVDDMKMILKVKKENLAIIRNGTSLANKNCKIKRKRLS